MKYCCEQFKIAIDNWQIRLIESPVLVKPYYEVRDTEQYTIFEIQYCPFCGVKLNG